MKIGCCVNYAIARMADVWWVRWHIKIDAFREIARNKLNRNLQANIRSLDCTLSVMRSKGFTRGE